MKRISESSFWRDDPTRTVDWRWVRAQKVLSAKVRNSSFDDALTAEVVRFFSARQSARTAGQQAKLFRRWPELAGACQLRECGGARTHELEGRLLTGAALAETASKMGLTEAVVTMYVEVFFDVIDFLAAIDWIALEVVKIGPWGSPLPEEASIWRYVGWHCPPALDLLIDDYYSRSASPDDRAMARRIRRLVKFSCTPTNHPSFAGLVQQMRDDGMAQAMVRPTQELAQALAQCDFLADVAKTHHAKRPQRQPHVGMPLAIPDGISISELKRDLEVQAERLKDVAHAGAA